MPRKPRIQTRRSVSMKVAAYDKIKAHADARNVTMSSVVEVWIESLPKPEAKP